MLERGCFLCVCRSSRAASGDVLPGVEGAGSRVGFLETGGVGGMRCGGVETGVAMACPFSGSAERRALPGCPSARNSGFSMSGGSVICGVEIGFGAWAKRR